MLRRAAQVDRPALRGEPRNDRPVSEHGFVSAVAGHLDVAAMPRKVVDRADDSKLRRRLARNLHSAPHLSDIYVRGGHFSGGRH